jgi:transaldolase
MEIFLDSANVEEIRHWLEQGVIDGVTTNPSIMLKDRAFDIEERAKEIASLIYPRPLSVEVTTNHIEQMIDEARGLASWAPNIAVKVPVINEFGDPTLYAVRTLTDEGVRVNLTACLSFGQVMLGAKAGAAYISIFAGRVSDEGHDASRLIREAVGWLRDWEYPSRIIVGSIREVMNIQEAALAGAHVITVPPQFMGKLADHRYTRETVRQFNCDAQEALARMGEVREASRHPTPLSVASPPAMA